MRALANGVSARQTRVRLDFLTIFHALFSHLRSLDGFCAEECGVPSFDTQLYIR